MDDKDSDDHELSTEQGRGRSHFLDEFLGVFCLFVVRVECFLGQHQRACFGRLSFNSALVSSVPSFSPVPLNLSIFQVSLTQRNVSGYDSPSQDGPSSFQGGEFP
jgi:hypothetical protein